MLTSVYIAVIKHTDIITSKLKNVFTLCWWFQILLYLFSIKFLHIDALIIFRISIYLVGGWKICIPDLWVSCPFNILSPCREKFRLSFLLYGNFSLLLLLVFSFPCTPWGQVREVEWCCHWRRRAPPVGHRHDPSCTTTNQDCHKGGPAPIDTSTAIGAEPLPCH